MQEIINPSSRKSQRKALVAKSSEILKTCETPDEFIGWLAVTARNDSMSMFDIIRSAIELGPEVFEKFKPEDWE